MRLMRELFVNYLSTFVPRFTIKVAPKSVIKNISSDETIGLLIRFRIAISVEC